MRWNRPTDSKAGDVEEGSETISLNPVILERPEVQWVFLRKIYTIVLIQLLLTIAVSSLVVNVKPISYFFVSSAAGLELYIFLIILPFIMIWPLYIYYQRHTINLILLGLLTVSSSFAVGLTCVFTNWETTKVILEFGILTAVFVVNLICITFGCAADSIDPFIVGAMVFLVLLSSTGSIMLIAIIQLIFPMENISNHMIFGALASLVFCLYIIVETTNLIYRYGYDEYIWASVALYLHTINLFRPNFIPGLNLWYFLLPFAFIQLSLLLCNGYIPDDNI